MKTAAPSKTARTKPAASELKARRELKRGVSLGLGLLAAGVLAMLYLRTL